MDTEKSSIVSQAVELGFDQVKKLSRMLFKKHMMHQRINH
jgi:hypothetical protein